MSVRARLALRWANWWLSSPRVERLRQLGIDHDTGGRCECRTMQPRNGEPYCPAHKYRWEYEQDEQAAHKALDALGAPTAGPHDELLSVAGRIEALHRAQNAARSERG